MKKQRSKKVLHILSTNKYSGAENVAITIIKELNKTNLYEGIYVAIKGPIEQKLIENNIKYELIPKLNLRELNRIIKKYNPAVIHAHDFKMSVLVSLCKKNNNTKIISHLHHNATWIKKINIKSIVYLAASLRFNKILAVSEAIKNEYIFRKYILSKMKVVSNPIDTNKILSLSSMKNDCDNIDVIYVGRLSKEKNPIRFIDIIEKLVQIKSNIRAMIIGDGILKKSCINEIKKRKLTNNIELLGFSSNPYTYMKRAKLLCITSEYEGYGLVAIEAICLGKPVVATNVGGLKNIIDNNNGKLCEKNKEFICEIDKLLNDNKYYIKKANYCLSLSKKLDNLSSYLTSIISIYKE